LGATVTYNNKFAGSMNLAGYRYILWTGSVPANDAHGNVTISFLN
jgi:hypothetical protein